MTKEQIAVKEILAEDRIISLRNLAQREIISFVRHGSSDPEMLADLFRLNRRGNDSLYCIDEGGYESKKQLCRVVRFLARCHGERDVDDHKDTKAREDKHYGYIPLRPASFADILWRIKGRLRIKKEDTKFLDVGAGIGSKMFIARYAMGWCTHGIEYSEELIGVARYLSRPFAPSKADALTYSEYRRYDIIYMYSPMRSPEMMRRLYERVFDQMRVGAFMVEALPGMFCDAFKYRLEHTDFILAEKTKEDRIDLNSGMVLVKDKKGWHPLNPNEVTT